MLVYVISKSGHPLMPTNRCGHIRYLLKTKKARVVTAKPFTVQLCYDTEEITQPLMGGTDPGRTNIGEAVINEKGETLYESHVATRNKDVHKLMEERKAYRRASRQGERKRRQRRAVKSGTVFRESEVRERILPGCEEPISNHYITNTEARFNNRKRPEGWITPTVRHLVETHLNMVDKICRILPVTDWSIEYNRFSFMKMDNPSVFGKDYQNGPLKGYKDVNTFIYKEQNGKCICCGNPIKHYHHIQPRHKNGSDCPENIVGLCDACHSLVHTRRMRSMLAKIGKQKEYAALSALNQAMPYIYKGLVERFGQEHVYTCHGYDTKHIRDEIDVDKTHSVDAACIAANSLKTSPKFRITPFEIVQFRRHNRAIINNQRERTYKFNGVTVAKNRTPRFEQKGPSLQDYLNTIPQKDRRIVCSRLTVTPSTRHYNNVQREYLPGCMFIYKKRRYVMTGQHSYGTVFRAYGQGKTNFPAKQCSVLKNGGLVYV